MSAIKLIVGLGNPGNKYHQTRHNAGQWFLNLICQSQNIDLKLNQKFQGLTAKIHIHNHECLLLFPTTYMNKSGTSVQALAHFYKIPPESILVCHDELDLPCGIAKLKFSGGHGGHNGLRDIQSHIGKQYHRLRIGIDRPNHSGDVINYVLSKPSKAQYQLIQDALNQVLDLLPNIVEGHIQLAMNQLHTK